jgi:hypothetical protein
VPSNSVPAGIAPPPAVVVLGVGIGLRPSTATTGHYYSADAAGFNLLSRKRQNIASSVGRIEETSDGMLAPQPCQRCRTWQPGRFASSLTTPFVCRIYTAAAWTRILTRGNDKAGTACSCCRFAGRLCSLVERHPANALLLNKSPLTGCVRRGIWR